LNRNGFSAAVLHAKPGFRCTWFDNQTVVKSSQEVQFQKTDMLVFPETWVQFIKGKMPGIKKVIFNQGAYLTFAGGIHDWHPSESPYTSADTIGALVVSEDSRQYLAYVFPDLAVFRVHNAIDPSLFYYSAAKKKQIAYMPRRGAEMAKEVLTCLRYRDILAGWEIVEIDNMRPDQVADTMREAMIFLNFGAVEGFSLPAAEAMACGCFVIGFHGMGGREFFKPEFSHAIEVNDVIGFAKGIETVIRMTEAYEGEIIAKGKQASEFILGTYTPARQEKDVCSFWEKACADQSVSNSSEESTQCT
jgi:glycosyltransferase involved in cell wall biosynthesis